jgi:serine/threonine-protein kinase
MNPAEPSVVDRPTEPGSADLPTSGAVPVRTAWSEGPESGESSLSQAPAVAQRSGVLSPSFDDLGPSPVVDPLLGMVVADRYRIVDGLGRGGMGVVYKVEHARIGKLLAMKLLTGELSRSPAVVRRFKHEALTASRLSSPNTVQVFDFGVADGLTYLVMELIAGDDIARTLRARGPIPFAELGRIIVQVCSSLAEAHQKGIVHRDIKPENVMLVRARDGSTIAKVLDFGLAKIREGSELSEVTSQGAIVGTPYFMAPEQVKGEPVDARTDIYAVGGLMYRALTGHYPFNGPTPMSVFTKHLLELPVEPTLRAPELGIPPGVSRIIMRALAKNPDERFARIEELQAAVVEELRELGSSSVDALLDSRALRSLVGASRDGRTKDATAESAAIATRDEVEAYERKLRRTRYGAIGVVGALVLAAGAASASILRERPTEFDGQEAEPNNSSAAATPIPFGRAVSGLLGKRIDASTSDRDFYTVDVPSAAPVVHLATTAIPNLAMCTLLYRDGLLAPLAQYCVGRPGRDLVIPALRLDPGRYFIAVMQDRDAYGAPAPPPVYENVSDRYRFTLVAAAPSDTGEIEPNDLPASANSLVVGQGRKGVLGWAHDEDVHCLAPEANGAGARFSVDDAARPGGVVLEVTPILAGEEGASVRIHTGGTGRISAGDVMAPWTSSALAAGARACLRVRLVGDPWIAGSNLLPSGGSEEYAVRVEPL